MSSRQLPAFAVSSAEAPQPTLVFARRAGLAVLLFLCLAGASRLALNQRDAETLRQRTADSLRRSVIAVHPRPGEGARRITLPASLRGNAETPIYARSNGYLTAWHKTIGDSVKQGDLLATIDVPELEHELAEARAVRNQARTRLDLAKSTLRRWEALRQTDSAAQQEYEEKRSAVPEAQADLEAADAKVRRLEQIEGFRRIVAPFSGVISRRNVEVGNLVNSAQELFALTQTDPLRLTVWVPQVYADEVRAGQEVAIRFPEAQGKTAKARVDHVAGALDPASRSRQVDVILPNRDGKLLPGAYVEVAFTLAGQGKALLVPANTLVIDQDGPHVVAVDGDSRIAFRPVKLGRDFGRDVEVLEGIGADDVLVASPSDLLVAGETVTAVEPPEKKAEGKGGEKTRAAENAGSGGAGKPRS
jgi:multidrug efflux system membrane fusion protein